MPQQPKRATIRDVAEATGLSPAAVSYALRGIQTSEETQERVRRAAAELGYKVDRIARALASGRTGTVGLLFGSLEDLWQQLLGAGIGSALLARDHYALLVDVDVHGAPPLMAGPGGREAGRMERPAAGLRLTDPLP